MPGAAQMGFSPDMWGLTLEQLQVLSKDVRGFYETKGERTADKTMRNVVEDIIRPMTRGEG